MKEIEVIFSPICEASGAFLGLLTEWLDNTDVKIISMAFNSCSDRQKKLYRDNGLLVNNRMTENCFVDVFYKDRLIDTVPLSMKKIFSALGIDCIAEENRMSLILPKPIEQNEIT